MAVARVRIVVVLLLAVVAGGCMPAVRAADDKVLRVHATTGHLADVVRAVAPGAELSTLVGPGGDPHTYQPATRDVARILDADVVISLGLGLEPQLAELLDAVGERHLEAGSHVPPELLLEAPGAAGAVDPHIWNSPEAWHAVIDAVADRLADVDRARAGEYRANAAAYAERLDDVAGRAAAMLDTIPPERRLLVTGHDAFAYFGHTFGLEVRATDFISTEARLSATQLSELADLIVERRVPVIFHDSQASPQAITSLREAVASRGFEVRVAEAELHADSLGSVPGEDTHLSVLEHNARAVAEALGQEQP